MEAKKRLNVKMVREVLLSEHQSLTRVMGTVIDDRSATIYRSQLTEVETIMNLLQITWR